MAASPRFDLDSIEGKSSVLRGIYAALGHDVRTGTFEDRLRTQREVYMMRLHPELEPYLPFKFTMYVRGPYSPDLAKAYYSAAEPARVDLAGPAADYAREILGTDARVLEAMATLVKICGLNAGNPGFTARDGLRVLVGIRPPLRGVAAGALDALVGLGEKHGLRLPGPCARGAGPGR